MQTRLLRIRICLTLVLVIGCVSGCTGSLGGPRVVLVPTTVDLDGVPYTILKLAETVEARVYVNQGGTATRSRNKVLLPEGWLLIPPPPPPPPEGGNYEDRMEDN